MGRVSREIRLGVSMASCVRLLGETPEFVLGTDGSALSIDVFGFELAHPVRVVTSEFTTVERPLEVASLSFRVEADGGEGWLPVFEGELEVIASRSVGVSVVLDGAYRPPGGALGAIVDVVALHRVADDAIDRYFDAITTRLNGRAADLDALSGVPI